MRRLRPDSTRSGRAAAFLLLVLATAAGGSRAESLEFTLHRVAGDQPGPTVLVIGGIQGDEPGGFNAASLLATHYRLRAGAIWVVPNLNFESIVRRSRGVHGDMNRKFPSVSPADPDFARVERIKGIITAPEVDYVLNLHDGSGFFRLEHVDRLRNPRRWGQCIIIDQEAMDRAPHAPLGELARRVIGRVNKALVRPDHRLHVKNTRTRDGNREMAKTLTYFAINEGKPAVGVEASKSLPTHERVYYHLQMVEAYLDELGLSFERNFALTPRAVRNVVDDNVKVAFYDRRLFLDMAGARSALRYVPMKKDGELHYEASSPLVAIQRSGNSFRVSYGNRRVTRLHPQFFEYDAGLEEVRMDIDGRTQLARVGTVVTVREQFTVLAPEQVRVNVIGWTRDGVRNEAGQRIRREDIMGRFSVDRAERVFRVELYRGPRFAGMVLVRFAGGSTANARGSGAPRPLS
jgi:hypothetical protein